MPDVYTHTGVHSAFSKYHTSACYECGANTTVLYCIVCTAFLLNQPKTGPAISPRVGLGCCISIYIVQVKCQQPRRAASSTASSVDEVAETNAQLQSLQEVVAAEDLASRGLRSEAILLLERAAEICCVMGSESALAQAAHHRQEWLD